MMDAQPLWDWMNERHRIYLDKRDKMLPPWTSDWIFNTYRFCNVFRELDTVTVWVRKNIREPYANHPYLWFMLAIARTINWPPTLQRLMDAGAWPSVDGEWDWRKAARVLQLMMNERKKVYTGAYMIRAESDPNNPWYDRTKQEYICGCVLGNLWNARDNIHDIFDHTATSSLSLQYMHEVFKKFHGWGPFMSYELVTDLRRTRYLELAPDIYTWANAGPGAIRGLNRLSGAAIGTPLRPELANTQMVSLLRIARGADGVRSPLSLELRSKNLEMRDIEHSLCETDKYLRVKNGEGRPRARYVAGRGW